MRQQAILAIAILSWFFGASGTGHAADRPGNITADGSGIVVTETLSNDTNLTGSVEARNQGTVSITVTDTSSISGNLTLDLQGNLSLTAQDSALIAGNLGINNYGNATISMSGDSEFRGAINVNSSGGYLTMTLSDNASLTGRFQGGSNTTSALTLNTASRITGGVEIDSGGQLSIILNDNSSLSGGMQARGGGRLTVNTTGSAVITSPLSVSGSATATLELEGGTAFTGDMDVSGSGTLNLTASDDTVIQGDIAANGNGTSTLLLNDNTAMSGNISTAGGSRTDLTLNQQSSLAGDVFSGGGSTTSLELNDSSFFRGSSAIDQATTNISLNSAGTAWYVTQAPRTSSLYNTTGTEFASAVSNLNVATGAWVYLGARNYNMNSAADRVQLDVINLSGNGNFELRVHVNGTGSAAYNDGDLLHVASTSGSHALYVPSAQLGLGGVPVNGKEILKVVHSLDGQGQYSLYDGKLVDIGHYSYKLIQQNNHWFLVASNAEGDGDPGSVDPVDPLPPGLPNIDPGFGINVDPPTIPLNRPAETAANFMTANYLITYLESQTLLQRMGDLRHCRQGDLWVRGFAGEMNSKRYNHLSSYSMPYYGFQIGADRKVASISENFFVGAMAGYTRADPRHSRSDSDIESFHGGLYATYGTEDDFYIDATAKLSHLRNKYSSFATDGTPVSGSGSGNAYSFGVEAGKRFYTSPLREGLYLEPQVQGIYTRQEKINVSADNGLSGRMSGYNSVLVRAGGLMGYDLKGGTVPLNVYVKAGYVRELTADVRVHYNDMHHKTYNYKSGWFDAGVGMTTEIARRHALYLDLEYASGKRFHKRQVNMGYRYAF